MTDFTTALADLDTELAEAVEDINYSLSDDVVDDTINHLATLISPVDPEYGDPLDQDHYEAACDAIRTELIRRGATITP